MGKKTATKTKAAAPSPAKKSKKVPVVQPEESSSEEESSEEEQVVVPTKQKKAPAKAAKKAAPPSSDEDSSEEESEEEKPAKKAAAQVNGKKKAAAPAEESDDDDSDEESSEEEAPKKKGAEKRKNGTAAPVAAKKAKKESSDDDDDEDDSSEEESEEEEKPKKKADKRKAEAEKEAPKKAKLDASATDGEVITLFVGGVAKEETEDEITSFFSENGVDIASVRKLPNKATAFVDLADSGDLDKALALNNSSINGKNINIEKAKPKIPKDQAFNQSGNQSFNNSFGGDDKDAKTLFAKSLPDDVDQSALGSIFDTASDIRIPMKDGYPKGFAFIEFEDVATMEKAMTAHQGANCNGRSIFLDYMGAKSSFKRGGDRGGPRGGRGGRGGFGDRGGGSSSGTRGETKTLFVKNLSYDTDEHSLKEVFDGCVSARIPTFPDSGKPKGFAFVEFTDSNSATAAFDAMSGSAIDGRQVTIDFAADKGSGGGGFGGRGGGGFGGRGRGGDRGGGRGFGGRGRGGDRGGFRGGRGGGFNKEKGGILKSEGKKKTFNDSD